MVTDYSPEPPPASTPVLFSLIDVDSGDVAQMRDHFFGPASETEMTSARKPRELTGRAVLLWLLASSASCSPRMALW